MSIISRIKYLIGLNKTPLDLTELNVIQDEMNRIKNECVDNINMQLNPMVYPNMTTSGTFPTLTPRPGSVIYANNTSITSPYVSSPRSVVQWNNYNTGSPTKEDTEEAEVLNTKKFKLIAEEFCKRNVEWNTVPDINQPLRKIRIMHSSKQLWIQDCFPMNEIAIIGGAIKLESQIGMQFPIHSMLQFERWAFGMEECPYGK